MILFIVLLVVDAIVFFVLTILLLLPLLLLLVSFVFVFFFGVVLFFVNFGEYAGHLLLQKLLKFLLRFLVKVVLLTEVECKLHCSVTLVDNYALLLVATEVDVHEKEGLLCLLGVVSLGIVIFVFIQGLLFFLIVVLDFVLKLFFRDLVVLLLVELRKGIILEGLLLVVAVGGLLDVATWVVWVNRLLK